METIYVQPSFSIPEKFEGPLSGVWQKIKENIQQLKALQGRCTTLALVLQAAEHEVDVKVQSNGKSASPEDPENKEQATESKEDVNVQSNGKSASPEDPVDKQQAAESIDDAKVQSNGRCQGKSASPEDPADKQHANERKENVNVQSNEKSASTEDPGGKQQAAESKENVNGQSNEKSASPEDPGSKQLQAAESKENVNGQSNVSIVCGSINHSENKKQAAESKEDVNVKSHEKSASPEDPEGKQQAAESKENVKVLSSDTTATRNISDKANTNGYRDLLIVLGIFTLLSGTYGDSGPVLRYHTRINQPVNLPSGAKVEDVVEWSLSPAQNSAKYISLYASDYNGKISRKDGCEGFDFGLNHSMFIASAQLCHAGTYTVDIRGGDSKMMVLIFDDVAENSTETTYESVTLPLSAVTPISNTGSEDVNIVMVVVVTLCCVFTFIVVIAIVLIWKRKSILKKASTDGNNVHASFAQANREENADLLCEISIVLPQS